MGIWQKNFSTALFLWKNFKKYLKYKHTSRFVLDKGNVRQGSQREFFCFILWGFFSPNISIFYIFLQIQHEVNIFLRFWTCLLHQVPLLAGHCSILSSCVWKSPVRTQPKLMFQGQTQYCFSQSYFLTYLETKKSQHLDFSFSCPWILFSSFSSQSQKTSQSVALCFSTEETAKHFCDAIYVNS